MPRPTLILSAALLSALAALGGCASYGFADADHNGSAPTLQVETLITPASQGLDASALRTTLIDRLEWQGLRVVGDRRAPRLHCEIIDDRATGVGRELFAELDLACHIRRAQGGRSFHATGQAADVVAGPSMSADDTRRATSRAIVDAIDQIAPQVQDYLANTAPQQPR